MDLPDNQAATAIPAMTPASASEQSGQRSETRIPTVAEIAKPRNGWRGHAVSSLKFRGRNALAYTRVSGFIYLQAESLRKTRYLSSQICSLEELCLCLEGYPQT